MMLLPPEEEQSELIHLVERIFEGVDRRGYLITKATLVSRHTNRRITRACTAVRMRWILADDFDPELDHDNHW